MEDPRRKGSEPRQQDRLRSFALFCCGRSWTWFDRGAQRKRRRPREIFGEFDREVDELLRISRRRIWRVVVMQLTGEESSVVRGEIL